MPPHYFFRCYLERAGQPVQCQESFDMIHVRELLDGVFANELAGQPAPLDRELLLGWIEDGDLLRAFEAMKSAYPDASLHLGNLRDAEKAYREQRISFEELGKEKARLRHAALSLLGK